MKLTFIYSLLLLIVLPTAAFSQSTYGALLGAVTDASGAPVPQAAVTVKEVNTNVTKNATTDEHGAYQIPNLSPGTYRVSVVHGGFDEAVQDGVPLDARATVRVDVVLQVGKTNSTIEVKEAAPVITTESGTVSDVTGGRQITQLPLNYRANSTSPFNAITLVPGVQVDSGGALSGNGNSFGFSVSGNHPAQNEVSVDGISITSPRYNGPLVEAMPSSEQISEMRVTAQAAPAEYGQIGDLAFIGKSGTNAFHGSLFEYLQNDALDATPLFTSEKPQKRNNDFGGSLSGPVTLPFYHGKDKTFFFVDYERNMQRNSFGVVNNVPTAAMLNGDFSSSDIPLINPSTGLQFPGNRIPASQFNPVSLNILKTFYPPANVINADPLDPNNNYLKNSPSPSTTDLYDIRIDQVITSKQSLFGRFSWKNLSSLTPLSPGSPQDFTLQPRTLAFSYNYALRPNLLNEFRFGYLQQYAGTAYPQFPNGADLISQLGFQQLGPFPPGSAEPEVDFNGSSGISGIIGGRQENLREKKIQFADNLTSIRGRHTLKAGFDIRDIHLSDYENFTDSDNFGDFSFNGSYTGNDFADFLLGIPNSTTIANAGPDIRGVAKQWMFYAQDSFRVNNRLTLDFGLRYEYHPPFSDPTYQDANFDRATGAVIVPNATGLRLATPSFLSSINACGLATPNPTSYGTYPCTPVITAQQAGLPSTLRISDKKKFLPRLGFAYRLNDKTVIRGGGGLYDQTLLGAVFYSLTGIQTSDYETFINSAPGSFVGGQPAIVFPNTKSTGGAVVAPAGNADFATANQIDLHDPYSEQWTFTVERALTAGTGLRVTYTGLRSIGLIVSPDLNQIRPQTSDYDPTLKPFPNFNVIKTRDNGGVAFYNGLETVVTHRFSQGLFFQSSWVWSKNLSNGEGDAPNSGFPLENGARISNRFDLSADRGDVSFTRRHRWLTTANFELPFGRGKKYAATMNRVEDAFLGGWSINSILTLQTGPFLTPEYLGGNDPSGTNAPSRPGVQRPDRLPASACAGLSSSVAQSLQGSCFFYGWNGAIGRFGNSGVGILTGPGTILWNAGAAKSFPLTESLRLRFEATATNVLNHPNLGTPNMSSASSSFGVISSLQGGSEGAGARTMQLALRLDF
jgi:hypothetical protein